MYDHMAIDDENLAVDRGIALHKMIRLITMIIDSDAKEFGGHGRLVPGQEDITLPDSSQLTDRSVLSVYIPNRTAIVLQENTPL